MDRVDVEGPAPGALFERVLGERIDADTARWLVEGFRRFDQLDGALPLERCLKLPTAAQRRLAERNYWLRAAAALVDLPTPSARADEVVRRLSAFMSRGLWREWKHSSSPPDTATELERALFHAARASGQKAAPQSRQVRRLLGVATDSPSNGQAGHISCEA